MILSGRKRSATSRANLRMTRVGISAPRYQRCGFSADIALEVMLSIYSVIRDGSSTQCCSPGSRRPHGLMSTKPQIWSAIATVGSSPPSRSRSVFPSPQPLHISQQLRHGQGADDRGQGKRSIARVDHVQARQFQIGEGGSHRRSDLRGTGPFPFEAAPLLVAKSVRAARSNFVQGGRTPRGPVEVQERLLQPEICVRNDRQFDLPTDKMNSWTRRREGAADEPSQG
jgi:hypothetical protein